MKLEYQFTRDDTDFGLDAVPDAAAYLAEDNVFNAPQYGVMSEPIASIAFAYEGPLGAPDAEVDLYLWDEFSELWYLFNSDTVPAGEIHYISLPNIIDRKDSRAVNKISVAVVANPAAAAPVGDYYFTMSSSTDQNSAGAFGDIIALLTAIEVDTTSIDGDTTAIAASTASIDGKIENPMPVEGATAVGAVPASDPLDLGAVVLDADPGAYTDGDVQRLRLDSLGRLIVTNGTASLIIEGVDADDDAVTVNPIVTGGVYYADPTLDTIDDGDVGYMLLNELRMLVTELRTYDSASDADRNVPVWNPTDLWTPEDLSGDTDEDGTTSYYVSLEENSRWSLQFIPGYVSTETITLTVHQSNEDDDDITARTYTDVTNTFFGTTGFTTENWVEIEAPTRAKSLRVDVEITDYDAGEPSDPSWDLWLMKGSNS